MTFYTAVNTSYQKTSEDQTMDGEVQLRKNSSINGKAPSQPFDVETIIKVDKSQKVFLHFCSKTRLKSLSVPYGYVIIDKFYRIVSKIVLKLFPRFL